MPLLGRSPSEMKRLNCSDLWQSSSYGTVEVVPLSKTDRALRAGLVRIELTVRESIEGELMARTKKVVITAFGDESKLAIVES